MNKFYDKMQEHTKVKIEFYKRYLDRYLSILVNSGKIDEINIYDLFCGTGIYEDNQFGSPIVARDAIQSVKERFNSSVVKINLFVNDMDKISIDKLTNLIQSDSYNFNISINNKNVNELYEVISNSIRSQNRFKIKNLIFLDPFGYSDINIEFVRDIILHGNSEFIIFLPITHIYRFISIREKVENLDNFLNSLNIFNESFEDIFGLIEFIKLSMKFDSNIFSSAYYLQKDQSNIHALFFISSNILGYERIIDLKWKLNEEDGKGFNLPEKNESLFAEFDKVEKIKNSFNNLYELTKDFIKVERNNLELYEFCLLKEYRITHINEVLRQLQNEEKIEVKNSQIEDKIKKGAFYINYDNYKSKTSKVIIKLK